MRCPVADTHRLPRPVSTIWSWQLRASCRGMDSNVFFHPDRERGADRQDRVVRAKQVCVGCPVIEQCRNHALAAQEPYGVWGGLTVAERTQVLRDRGVELAAVIWPPPSAPAPPASA